MTSTKSDPAGGRTDVGDAVTHRGAPRSPSLDPRSSIPDPRPARAAFEPAFADYAARVRASFARQGAMALMGGLIALFVVETNPRILARRQPAEAAA